jgi:hypothetical protein
MPDPTADTPQPAYKPEGSQREIDRAIHAFMQNARQATDEDVMYTNYSIASWLKELDYLRSRQPQPYIRTNLEFQRIAADFDNPLWITVPCHLIQKGDVIRRLDPLTGKPDDVVSIVTGDQPIVVPSDEDGVWTLGLECEEHKLETKTEPEAIKE